MKKTQKATEVKATSVPAPAPAPTVNQARKAKGGAKVKTSYQSSVLDVNKALKAESKTFGHSVGRLISYKSILKKGDANLTPEMSELLNRINTDSVMYKKAQSEVTRSKSGNYSPFYLLQYLHKQTNGKKGK